MRRLIGFVCAAIGILAAAAAASAQELDFRFTGEDDMGGYSSLEFDAPLMPTPISADLGHDFEIQASNTLEDGSPYRSSGIIDFSASGGLGTDNYYVGSTEAFYTGPESSPTFKMGTFDVTHLAHPGVLTISFAPVSGGGPEPSTWALMMVGVFGAGLALRWSKGEAAHIADDI